MMASALDFQIECVGILKQLLIVFAKHNNEAAFARFNQAIVVIAKYIGMTLQVRSSNQVKDSYYFSF